MPANILVVEHEEAIRKLLRVAFLQAGYEPQFARNPETAKKAIREHCIDLMLAETGTQLDGHELARWVAVESPKTQVILISGWESGCDQCPYAPRCHILTKPFRVEDVIAAVAQALDNPSNSN
jgi:DNA-binding NtrC family response regulator